MSCPQVSSEMQAGQIIRKSEPVNFETCVVGLNSRRDRQSKGEGHTFQPSKSDYLLRGINRYRKLRAEPHRGSSGTRPDRRKQGRGCLIVVCRRWANSHAASFSNPSA
jgi:hypothetical protein